MPRINKYVPGKRVKDTNHMCKLLAAGEWVYWKGVPKSPAWLENMPLFVVHNAIKTTDVRVAKLNPKWKG